MNAVVQLGTGKKRHRNKCDLFSHCKMMDRLCKWRTFAIYLPYWNGKILDFFNEQKRKVMKVFQEGRTIYWKWLARTIVADVFCINFQGDTWKMCETIFFLSTLMSKIEVCYIHINSAFHAFLKFT